MVWSPKSIYERDYFGFIQSAREIFAKLRFSIVVRHQYFSPTHSTMTGFVPSTALFGGRQSQPHVAACRRVVPHNAAAIPFFASSAFGSPVPARIRPPLPVAPVEPDTSHESAAPFVLPRMEVTIIVGENEPVESGMFSLAIHSLNLYCTVFLFCRVLAFF